MSLEDAGKLLREFQLNEWALDRRITKTALRQQKQIIKRLLEAICCREVTTEELDHVLSGMN